MSGFDHLAGGALQEPTDPAFPRVTYTPGDGPIPRRKFLLIGGRQYQADAGSCVAHGYSAVAEAWAASIDADFEFCRQDIYLGARLLERNGAETRDGGAYPSKAREWLREYGTVSEARKPYKASDVTTWRPPAEWAADRKLLAMRFDPLTASSSAIVQEVANGGAVAICHAVYRSMLDLPANGVESVDVRVPGGHCRVVVGYDFDQAGGCALVMNSWKSWGRAHPLALVNTHFHGLNDSFSWVPFAVLDDPAWLQNADRLALPPEVLP